MTLEELILGGEGQRVEFKQSFAAGTQAVESLCAFAHAAGGVVLFGIDPNGNTRGVDIGANTLETFANQVRSETDPPLAPRIDQESFHEKKIVRVEIMALPANRIVSARGRYYIRVGRVNAKMSSAEIERRVSRQGRTEHDPIAVVRPGNEHLRELEEMRRDIAQALRS